MPDRLAFSSLNELIASYNATAASKANNVSSRIDSILPNLEESVNLLALERLYLPTNIPSEYQLHQITVFENNVSLVYLHIDDLVSEDTIVEALIHQRHFLFNFTRWNVESPMEGILQQNDATIDDLIDGKYLLVEPNLLIWASDNEVIYMYVPLMPRHTLGQRELTNDDAISVEHALEQIRFTETMVVDLRNDA